MITFLENKGYFVNHIKGSHFVLYKPNIGRVVVPRRKELPIGTILAILREINSTKEELLCWLINY